MPNRDRRPPPSRPGFANRPRIRIRTSPVPWPRWCWSTIWSDPRLPAAACSRDLLRAADLRLRTADRVSRAPGPCGPARGACRHRRLEWPRRGTRNGRAPLRSAAGTRLRVSGGRPPRTFPAGVPDRRRGRREGRGSRPAGAGGVARPNRGGGGRHRLHGRPRRLRPRQHGRERARPRPAARSGAVPRDEVVRGRSQGVAPLHRPARGARVVPSAKAEGLRRWPGTERLLGNGEIHLVRQASTTSRSSSNGAPERWRRPTSA